MFASAVKPLPSAATEFALEVGGGEPVDRQGGARQRQGQPGGVRVEARILHGQNEQRSRPVRAGHTGFADEREAADGEAREIAERQGRVACRAELEVRSCREVRGA